jgi:DNA-binding GntR family transcriptional regulator
MSAADTPSDENNPPLDLGLRGRKGKGKTRKASDQTIYEAIYEAVLAQRLPPGTKLPELILGDLFGVSRSIVRKALTRLISDHVVDQQHNQVATVAKPSTEETCQIFQARRVVEAKIVRLNAGQLTKPQLAELKRLVHEENLAHEGNQLQSRSQHGMRLHLFLAECCPNRVLGAIQRHLVLRTSIAISLYKAAGASSCFLGDDHARLVQFIERGEGDKASDLARQHLERLENLLNLADDAGEIDLASALKIVK